MWYIVWMLLLSWLLIIGDDFVKLVGLYIKWCGFGYIMGVFLDLVGVSR